MPYQVKANAGRKERDAAPAIASSPSANKVTPEQIQALKDRVLYITPGRTEGNTSTFVHAYLDGRFFLGSGHSACVDPANFDADLGVTIARRNAEYAVNQKLWELEGYRLYNNLV